MKNIHALARLSLIPENGQGAPTSAVYDPKTGWSSKGTGTNAPEVDFLQVAVALGDCDLAMSVDETFTGVDHFGESNGNAFNGCLGMGGWRV
nr:hypothetical protein [uncultured Sphingorhabdus sp.]